MPGWVLEILGGRGEMFEGEFLTSRFPFDDCFEEADGLFVRPRVVQEVFFGFAGGLRGGCGRFVLVGRGG